MNNPILPLLILLVLSPLVLLPLVLSPSILLGQSFRYMDESGNIFFVDNPNDIPAKYRGQVIKATPTPFLTKEMVIKRRKQVQHRKKPVPKKKNPQKNKGKEVAAESKDVANNARQNQTQNLPASPP